jgi:hypothetical protein
MPERYERDGFCDVDQLLDPDELAQMRAVVEDSFSATPDATTCSITADDMSLRGIVLRAGAEAERLLGDDVRPTFVKLHRITFGLEHGRGWHQALAYHHLPFTPHAVDVRLDDVEVLVMLDDCTDLETCTWFAPGYHVSPLMEHRRRSDGAFELVDPMRQIVMSETVPLRLRAGDAVAYTLGTPHTCWASKEGAPVRAVRIGFQTPRGTDQ